LEASEIEDMAVTVVALGRSVGWKKRGWREEGRGGGARVWVGWQPGGKRGRPARVEEGAAVGRGKGCGRLG
jgi:hypothetical protein